MFKTLPGFILLAAAASGLSGCTTTPPGYDPHKSVSAHPPGHPDWDWYCPHDGGSYFPEVTQCPTGWLERSDGPTAKVLAEEKGEQVVREQRKIEAQKQKDYDAKIAMQEDARLKAIGDIKADIVSRGYTKTSLADLIIDFKNLPSDQKLYLTGFYNHLGTSDIISASPTSMSTIVTLSMEGTPRAVRKSLLECVGQNGMTCAGTFLMHTGCITMQSSMERDDIPCVVLDDVKQYIWQP